MACAVRDLFRQDNVKRNDAKVPSAERAIIKSLEATFALISERSASKSGRGRHKLNDRIVREVLTTAIMMAVPDDVTVNAMKRALDAKVDWHALRAGLNRAHLFKNNATGLSKAEESSCGAYPTVEGLCMHNVNSEVKRRERPKAHK